MALRILDVRNFKIETSFIGISGVLTFCRVPGGFGSFRWFQGVFSTILGDLGGVLWVPRGTQRVGGSRVFQGFYGAFQGIYGAL